MADATCLDKFNSKVPFSEEDMRIEEGEYLKLKENSILLDIKEDEQIIKIYSLNRISLSKIIPVVNDIGIEVVSDISYFITHKDDKIYANKFSINVEDIKKLKSSKENIIDIIVKTLTGNIEKSSRLFKLIYLQNLSHREVNFIDALINYQAQLLSVSSFDRDVIIETFTKHNNIVKEFVVYFLNKFDPTLKNRTKVKSCAEKIELLMKEVENINEDKVLKRISEIVLNIVRTNYFLNKDDISLKIMTNNLTGLRGVQPRIEAFVYHKDLNGVHLRMSKVARGGLRWSERYEDFRDEIKSLMSTQEGKNSIIVPGGAKGGFVIYKEKVTKDEFKKYYSIFINSILDLADNKINNEIVRDEKIIAYDGDDPYFVVAADKGTAQMSDVANEISISRNFWLKDAFASGGSKGYSHKDLGITAKGSIKATERFFIEKGVNIYETPISVVGIGSMRGDVFGNGILLSDKFKLVATVSSREIFIDPNPDPEISYKERTRLFEISGNWSEYDKKKISKGGGVFKRSSKEITITEEVRKLFKISKKVLSGEELGNRILKAKVDLIFNGGVGTYFKASDENNIEVGDKQNEALRVDATEIKAYAVCEGGNLGFTQKARNEYAKNGGKINLDSIDNSAGVDISDHEVNLKIVLNSLVEKGVINEEERVEVLKSLTESVMNSVLWTNYLQSLTVSLDEIRSKDAIEPFLKALSVLENHLDFRRVDFAIPKNADFAQALSSHDEVVRPILSTMISYSKHFLTSIIFKSELSNSPFTEEYLFKYFPKAFGSIYDTHIKSHPLRREIISMMIANKIINNCGSKFIADYDEIGEDNFILKIKSYLIVNQLFGLTDIRYKIYRDDFIIDTKKQYKLLREVEKSIYFSINWMLKHLRKKQIDSKLIMDYRESLKILINSFDESRIKKVTGDEQLDRFFSLIDYLKFTVAAIDIEEKSVYSFEDVAKLFYIVIDRLNVIYIMNTLNSLHLGNEWEEQLQLSLLDILNSVVVDIVNGVLEFKRIHESIEHSFDNYINENKIDIKEYNSSLDKIKKEGDVSLIKLASTITSLHSIIDQ